METQIYKETYCHCSRIVLIQISLSRTDNVIDGPCDGPIYTYSRKLHFNLHFPVGLFGLGVWFAFPADRHQAMVRAREHTKRETNTELHTFSADTVQMQFRYLMRAVFAHVGLALSN